LSQIRPTKCTQFNVLIYKTVTCLGQHRTIIRVYSCTVARPYCHRHYTELWERSSTYELQSRKCTQ